MNNKFINAAEAVTHMGESLLKLLHAIRSAKIAINNVLRMQYKAAGYPFGESEEGLFLWREKLAKDYALFHKTAATAEVHGNGFGVNQEDSLYVSDHFSSLKEEVQKRMN